MSAVFDQVGQLLEWLADWFPRICICRATHRGVRFKWGKHKVEIKPGVYVFWPRVTEAFTYPVVQQTVNLPMQTLVTKDGVTVSFSGVVVFEITNIIKALGDTWDIEENVGNVSLRVAGQVLTTHDFVWLRENLTSGAERKLTVGCRSDLRKYGIKVLQMFATDFAPTRTYRIIGDSPKLRDIKSSEDGAE